MRGVYLALEVLLPRAARGTGLRYRSSTKLKKERRMSDDVSSPVQVIAVTFEDDSDAYEALTTLEELEWQRQIGIRGVGVVVREELLYARHEKHMEHVRERIAEWMAKLHRHKKVLVSA
jgi:hypothetical protein